MKIKKKSLKKNLTNIIKQSTKKIFFFDEARFGTHSKVGHGWFIKGSRTMVKVKLGFKNFYLYSAVEVGSGSNFTLHLPYVNTECMQLFLNKFSEELHGECVTIIMDGAGWHTSKTLIVPSNIEIIYLPPYSPELNPVERLWLYIKKAVLYNKIYDTLEELENVVAEFITNLQNHTIIKICNYNYMHV